MKFSILLSMFVLTVVSTQAQTATVTVSGLIKNKTDKTILPFVNVVLNTEKTNVFVTGTVTNEEGRLHWQT